MALNLYTLHGIAHLVHVAWPIAQYILWKIDCDPNLMALPQFSKKWKLRDGKNWLQSSLMEVRDSKMFPSKNSQDLIDLLTFENNIGNDGASSSIGQEIHANENLEEQENQQSFYTDIWFWFYSNLKEDEHDQMIKNQIILDPTLNCEDDEKICSGNSSKSPFKSIANNLFNKISFGGLKKDFSKYQKIPKIIEGKDEIKFKSETDNENIIKNKKGKEPIKYDNILTIEECGPWLAIMWFLFKVVVFGLGWMLLALQYFP
uniref:Uncharacterized protein n=1 Tax=Meloidogyne enterolobii TaxID=390850 RepID=A0A6V7W2V9_MELEN|nr:unnamed protein product [Meloidogyne enterolobii]